jgi:cytochrome c oxidase assembly factor CtaG
VSSSLPEHWETSLGVIVPVAVLLVLFAQAFLRLRMRGRRDHAGFDRALLYVLALAIGTLALLSPLDAAGEDYLLSAHMLQHVLIADAAPALALVALRGPLVFFLLPPQILGPLARLRPLRRVLSWLLRPAVSVAAWMLVIALWHVPTLYDATLRNKGVHDLEHALFILVGVLVWTQIVDPARRGVPTVPQRLVVVVWLFAAGQILAYVYIFSFHALYPPYAHQHHRVFGWSPVLDQQLAGVAMMIEQFLTLGAAAALLLMPRLQRNRYAIKAASAARKRASAR